MTGKRKEERQQADRAVLRDLLQAHGADDAVGLPKADHEFLSQALQRVRVALGTVLNLLRPMNAATPAADITALEMRVLMRLVITEVQAAETLLPASKVSDEKALLSLVGFTPPTSGRVYGRATQLRPDVVSLPRAVVHQTGDSAGLSACGVPYEADPGAAVTCPACWVAMGNCSRCGLDSERCACRFDDDLADPMQVHRLDPFILDRKGGL